MSRRGVGAWFWQGARLLLMALLVWWIVRRVEWDALIEGLRSARLSWLAAGTAILVLHYALRVFRWRVVLKALGISVNAGLAAKSLLAGQGVGMLTPAHAGEISRVAFLPEGSRGRGAVGFVFDRCFDVFAVCLLGLAGAFLYFGEVGFVVLLALGAASICAIILPRWMEPLRRVGATLAGRDVFGDMRDARIGNGVVLCAVLLSIGAQVVAYGSIACYVKAVRDTPGPVCLLVFPLVTVTTLLPLTPGNVGVREGAAMYLFERAGLDPVAGVLGYLLLFAIGVLVPGALGLIWAGVAGNATKSGHWAPPSGTLTDCCHCGMCVAVCPNGALVLDERKYPAPGEGVECSHCGLCARVCPGRAIDFAALERGLAAEAKPDPAIGPHLNVWLARDTRDDVVRRSSSGGVVSALVKEALASGVADRGVGVEFVSATSVAPRWVRYAADIEACRQSKYQVAAVCSMLRDLPEGERLVFVGTGCQVAAVRKLQSLSPQWRERIPIVMGIFCSTGNLAPEAVPFLFRAMGVNAKDVTDFRFRDGAYPGEARVTMRDGTIRVLHKDSYKWLYPLFTEPRCMRCPDLPNTLADISVGDPFSSATDGLGQSAVIVRTAAGARLFDSAVARGALRREPLSPERLCDAQWMAFAYARWRVPRMNRRGGLRAAADGFPVPSPRTRLLVAGLETVFGARMLLRGIFLVLPGRAFVLASEASRRG